MKTKSLFSKYFLIGDEIIIEILSDCYEIFDIIEMIPESGYILDERKDKIQIFIITKPSGKIDLLKLLKGEKEFNHPNLSVYNECGTRHGDWYGKAISSANFEKGLGVIFFPGYEYYNSSFFYRMILRPFLDTMLISKKYIPFHGASFSKNDTGWLIVGQTGTGKSTIIKEFVENGYNFLGDDRIVINTSNPSLLLNFPDHICSFRGRELKKELHKVISFKKNASLKSIIILENLTDCESFNFSKLSKAESAARLILYSSVSYGNEIIERDRLSYITKIVEKTECFLISGFGDISEKKELVKQIIDGNC